MLPARRGGRHHKDALKPPRYTARQAGHLRTRWLELAKTIDQPSNRRPARSVRLGAREGGQGSGPSGFGALNGGPAAFGRAALDGARVHRGWLLADRKGEHFSGLVERLLLVISPLLGVIEYLLVHSSGDLIAISG
jgi:hypothetical protein